MEGDDDVSAAHKDALRRFSAEIEAFVVRAKRSGL